jgi:hypothetical protein
MAISNRVFGFSRAFIMSTGLALGRLASGSGAPRRILPVSRPQPSGDHTTAPTLIHAERHEFPFIVATRREQALRPSAIETLT